MPPVLVQLLTDDELRAVIGSFYDALYQHDELGGLFAGVEQRRQEARLFGFIRLVGGRGYDPAYARYLRDAHAHLGLTPRHGAMRWAVLERAILAHGHGDDVVDAWKAFDESWRRVVV